MPPRWYCWLRLLALGVGLLCVGPLWAASVTYEYDNLGRLTGAFYDDGTQITYTYDANGNRLTAEVIGGGVLAITTASLTDATQGQSYSATLAARGGSQPYAWSVSAGALPAGLALNATSGAITGTPTAVGAASLTAKVTDGANASAQRAFTLLVYDPAAGPGPTLDAPQSPTTLNPHPITGRANPNREIRLYVNGKRQATTTSAADGAFAVKAPLLDGVNTLFATQVDNGIESRRSNTISIEYLNRLPRTQGGTISQDTVWTPGTTGPYSVTSTLTVAAGVKFTVQPGVQVKFSDNTTLIVNGTLVVQGSDSARAVFTSARATPVAKSWVGIEIGNTATAVSIDYAQIEYATNGLFFNGGAGTVRHSLIRNNDIGVYVGPQGTPTLTDGNEITANRYGIYARGDGTAANNPTPVITVNSLYANSDYNYYTDNFGGNWTVVLNARGNWWGSADPAVIANNIFDYTDYNYSPFIDYGSYLTTAGGNPKPGVSYLVGWFRTNTTLSAGTYEVLSNVGTAIGTTLTIPAGTTLRFPGNFKFEVDGTLIVQGSAASRVVFTSGKSTPAARDWPGLQINTTATAVSIDYAQIEYATNGLFFNGGAGTVRHSLIRNNDIGVYVGPQGTPTLTDGNEITTNQFGLYVRGDWGSAHNPTPVVTGNSLYSNTRYDYLADAFGNPATTVLNARGNWWGSTNATAIASAINDYNDTGYGAVVDFSGFLSAVPGANQAPTVTLTAPASGAAFASGATITLQATASDSDGTVAKVEFFQGTTKLGEDLTSPYSYAWAGAAVGNYSLTAKATDNAGAVTTSAAVAISVYTPVTVTLQDGLNSYVGTRDTQLSSANPTTNYGPSVLFQEQVGVINPLVRFAIFQSEGGPVPNGATIVSATVSLYKYSGPDHVYRLHRVLKNWNETQAHWTRAATGLNWTTAGAAGQGTDIVASADGQGSVATAAGWLTIDVTAGVQALSAGAANYGWRLVAVSGSSAAKSFRSRDATTNTTQRPKLVITYRSN